MKITSSHVGQAKNLWRRLSSYTGDHYYSMSIDRRKRFHHATDRALDRYLRRYIQWLCRLR
jgi:hypothetical protein